MKRKALFLFGVNIFERSNFKMNWIRKDFPQGFNVHVNVEPAIGLVLKMLQYRGLLQYCGFLLKMLQIDARNQNWHNSSH